MSFAGPAIVSTCVVLAGLLGLEVVPATARSDVASPALAITQPEITSRAALPIGTWADTALDRPLFAPDRRPTMTIPAAQGMPVPLPRLAGTIASSGTLLAILAPAGGAVVAVRQGDLVSGWTVTRITEGLVTLTQAEGGRTTTLRLSYADGPRAGLPEPIRTPAGMAGSGLARTAPLLPSFVIVP